MAKEIAVRWYKATDTIPDNRQRVAGIVYAAGASVPDELLPLVSRSYPIGTARPDGLKPLAAVRYTFGDSTIPPWLRQVAIQPPASYFADTFTRADSATSLGTSETGQVWTPGDAGDVATLPVWGVRSAQAYLAVNNGQTDPHAWVETGLADCTISANVTVPTSLSSDIDGLLFRRQDGSNYFYARLWTAGNSVAIFRNLAGTRTNAASAAVTLTDGQTVALKVVLSGSTIMVYCDGVLKITYTDTNLQSATKHGLLASTNTTDGSSIDNFLVTV